MYEQTLQHAGLTQKQAIVYEALLKNGPLTGGKLFKKIPLKRGLLYKTLNELYSLDIIKKIREKNKPTIFKPNHPLVLKQRAEHLEQEAKDAQMALTAVIPNMISDFNLISGKPGVRFFEGIDGLKRIYEDTLVPNSIIYGLASLSVIEPSLFKWLEDVYVAKRKKKNIKFKVIVSGSKKAKEYHQKDEESLRKSRLVPFNTYPTDVEINIYDQKKIAFISYRKDELVGVIIESPAIYKTMKSFFALAWEQAKNLKH